MSRKVWSRIDSEGWCIGDRHGSRAPEGCGTEISESTSVKRVIARAAAGADDEPNRLPGNAAAVVLSVDLVREDTGVGQRGDD